MKKTYINYKSFGKSLTGQFDLYSDQGKVSPKETNYLQLLDGMTVDIEDNSNKIYVIPRTYNFLISGNSIPQMSGLKFYQTTGVFNSNPIYFDSTDTYALWKAQTVNSWYVTTKNRVGAFTTSPSSGFSGLGGSNITGNYTGRNWTGVFSISQVQNYLIVYNTPGIPNFAGTYTSGIYTISGASRTGFRNIINTNFYIYKNTSPSEWRAVEAISTNNAFTWYKNLNTVSSIPTANEWILGDNVSGKYAPTPETNFGTCEGDTLFTNNYIFELSSFDTNTNGLKFYSGGYINSDGTSNIFAQGVKAKDFFPTITNNAILRNFYYTEYKNQNRCFLFRGLNNWLIADLSGHCWKKNNNSYFFSSGNTTLNNATGGYLPTGNNTLNVKNISITVNPYFSNQDTFQYDPINVNTFTLNGSGWGLVYLSQDQREESTIDRTFTPVGNTLSYSFNNADLSTIQVTNYWNDKVSGNIYSGSGSGSSYYTEIPEQLPFQITISGANTGHFIQWFSAPYDDGPYDQFTLYSGSSGLQSVKTNSTTTKYVLTGSLPYTDEYLILSGSGVKNYSTPLTITISNIRTGNETYTVTSKIINIPGLDGFYNFQTVSNSNGLKGLVGQSNFADNRINNYVMANPEFQITGAKSPSSGTNIWSLLNLNLTYQNWKNFESNPSILPFQYWMSGSGMYESMINLKYIPLYTY